MVRTIEIPGDQIAVNGDEIKVHADVGPGRVVSAIFKVDDTVAPRDPPIPDPATMALEEWERNLNEMIAMMPVNRFPCDDSREAMYGPDPDEGTPA